MATKTMMKWTETFIEDKEEMKMFYKTTSNQSELCAQFCCQVSSSKD